jgi:hypothetical protein
VGADGGAGVLAGMVCAVGIVNRLIRELEGGLEVTTVGVETCED